MNFKPAIYATLTFKSPFCHCIVLSGDFRLTLKDLDVLDVSLQVIAVRSPMLWSFLGQTFTNVNARELMQELLHCGRRISSRLQAFAAHYLPMAES